jgi:PadR family transcriptional regulator PadR
VTRTRRPSPQTAAILHALAADPTRWRYGYELCLEVGLQAGSVYPILIRLADREMVEAAWETEPEPGRPPRHLYRLTGQGLAAARALPATSTQQARRAQPVRRRPAPKPQPGGA